MDIHNKQHQFFKELPVAVNKDDSRLKGLKAVYMIENTVNGRAYIGSTMDMARRIVKWKDWRNCIQNKKIVADFKKFGFNKFVFYVIFVCPEDWTWREVQDKEYEFIHKFNPYYNEIGKKRNEKTIAIISQKLKGLKQDASTINKRCESIRKRHLRIPQSNYGHRKLVLLPDLDILVIGEKYAAEYMGCSVASIRNAIRGHRNNVKGVRFEILEIETNGSKDSRVGHFHQKCKVAEMSVAEIIDTIGSDQDIIDPCYRSGEVTMIQAHEVYEKDYFEYELGLDPKLKHIPHRGADRGDMIYVYAMFKTKTGATGFACMSKEEVEEHAKRFSKSYDYKTGKFFGPWETDFVAMAKKTVLLQALVKSRS